MTPESAPTSPVSSIPRVSGQRRFAQTRLVDVLVSLDPKLVAAALGMNAEGLLALYRFVKNVKSTSPPHPSTTSL